MEYYSSLDASKLDSETPTLFELISANQLESLLSPSLRYVLVYYAQRYPGYLLRVLNRFDELNLALRLFVEWYFLTYWHGTFTENFYGLKRVRQTPLSGAKYNASKLTQLVPSMIEERRKISTLQKIVSVFEVTGLAYVSEKLTYQYELLYSKHVTNQLDPATAATPQEARRRRLQGLFVRGFPYAQATWRVLNLLATLSFLSGASKSPSLLTFLFKMNYARLNQHDYTRNEPALKTRKDKVSRVRPATTLETLTLLLDRRLARPILRTIRYVLGTFFPAAIFTLKFLEWWNNSDFAQKVAKSQRNALEDRLPPPSVVDRLNNAKAQNRKLYKAGNTCPLCKDEMLNPAIIETGHVFCYTCIHNYLRDSHKLVGKRLEEERIDSESESEEEDNGAPEKSQTVYDISMGGRCPITGQKLLGCKYNELTGEFDVEGIRRLIF